MPVGWTVEPGAIGLTGTRRGATPPQERLLSELLQDAARIRGERPVSLSHGDCVGVDQQAHGLARAIGGFWIYGHPPLNPRYRAFCDFDAEYEPLEYLVRNRVIVDTVGVLLAVPGEATEVLRSGTWSTVRYAREVGVPVKLVLPDGEVRDG